MGWVCQACGTDNAASAAFCGMCKSVPGRAAPRRSSAPPPASGLDLDVPKRVVAARPAPTAIASQSFVTGNSAHVAIAQEGSVLRVSWSPSLRGRIGAVIAFALGAAFLWAANAAASGLSYRADDPVARFGAWALVGVGGVLMAAAVVRVGLTVVHEFDARARQVVRTRNYFGLRIAGSTFTLADDAQVRLHTQEYRSRYRSTYTFTVLMRTGTGDTSVLVTEGEEGAKFVANAIAAHLA